MRIATQAVVALFLLSASFCDAAIIVHSERVLHERSPLLGGTNIKAHDANFALGAGGTDFIQMGREARVPLIRTLAYPDKRGPGHDPTPDGRGLDYFDRNVEVILTCGARPLFIQYIEPGLRYLTSSGEPGGDVSENLVFLVKRYAAPPYNLAIQYWEIGNEPDHDIDYRVDSPATYTQIFNKIHDALVAAGLRESVRLCGPTVVSPYRHVGRDWDNTKFIDAVLRDCRHSVDVVTYHSYSPHGDEWGEPVKLLNDPTLQKLENANRNAAPPDDFGAAALSEAIRAANLERPHAGIGLTEYNTNTLHQDVAAGLYNLMIQQHHAKNSLSRLTCSFVFDDVGESYGGNGHFSASNDPNANYWALWIAGNLRGHQVLEALTPSEDLLVLATRSGGNVFVEVINRTNREILESLSVTGIDGAKLLRMHLLDDEHDPEQSRPGDWTEGGELVFPPLSATVLVFSR